MKLNKNITLTTVAIGAALALALPGTVRAFTLLGGNLGIGAAGNGFQRDVRVFNNAVDAAANNNVIAETAFPGSLGAPLAVRKGADAWASTNVLAARNFDFDWQGPNASSAGNQNTFSWGDSGCGGGTLAYCETPISDGWRILMCESAWNWADGPGAPTGNQVDIQGIATHEIGHALGLGHSQNGNCPGACGNNPTMCPFACGSGFSARTIAADDQSGLQAIYNVIPGNKPTITSISGSTVPGQVLTLHGTNFASPFNVKFTAGTSTNTGAIPGVVTNATLVSSTQIDVVVPAAALDGNVFVWRPSIPVLSNGFPIDIGVGCQLTASVYCTSKLNSVLCLPSIGFTGQASATSPTPFDITGTFFLNNKNGLLFYGFTPNGAAFQGGHLCVKLPTTRTTVQDSGGNPPPNDCSGTYTYDFNALIQGGTDPNLGPAVTVYAQYWARDPADLAGFATSLSDAIQFEICP